MRGAALKKIALSAYVPATMLQRSASYGYDG